MQDGGEEVRDKNVHFICTSCSDITPVDEERIKKGVYAKAIFRTDHPDITAERMWIRIEKIDYKRRKATGILLNKPMFITNLKYEDKVSVDFNQIIEVAKR